MNAPREFQTIVDRRPRYEAHITGLLKDAEHFKATAAETRWKYSQIHGCPIMGNQTYCYLTSYDASYEALYDDMQLVCMLLHRHGVVVQREKIERIMFDSKTGHIDDQVRELRRPDAEPGRDLEVCP